MENRFKYALDELRTHEAVDDYNISTRSCDAIKEALHQAHEQRWRDIESAPHDGIKIRAIDVNRGYDAIVKRHKGEWECCSISGEPVGIGFYPSHWMPLPPAPTAQEGGEQ